MPNKVLFLFDKNVIIIEIKRFPLVIKIKLHVSFMIVEQHSRKKKISFHLAYRVLVVEGNIL